MSRYMTFLDGETVAAWTARLDKVQSEVKTFEQVLVNISDLAVQLGTKPEVAGFMQAWLGIMFADLSDEQRQYALERFIRYDSEMVLKKLSIGAE